MKLLLLLAAVVYAADPDPNQIAAQAAAAAAAAQGGQAPGHDKQGGAGGGSGAGSGFRELKAPVIIKKNAAPAEAEKAPTPAKPQPKGGGVIGGVRLPRESAKWEPVAVTIGGAPTATACAWRGAKKTKPGKASARLEPVGDDKRLIVSIEPQGLGSRFEIRLLIVEDVLDKAALAAVTPEPQGFQEESPNEARVQLSALDIRPGKNARLAGTIRDAEFAERLPNGLPGFGTVKCDFVVKGLEGK